MVSAWTPLNCRLPCRELFELLEHFLFGGFSEPLVVDTKELVPLPPQILLAYLCYVQEPMVLLQGVKELLLLSKLLVCFHDRRSVIQTAWVCSMHHIIVHGDNVSLFAT